MKAIRESRLSVYNDQGTIFFSAKRGDTQRELLFTIDDLTDWTGVYATALINYPSKDYIIKDLTIQETAFNNERVIVMDSLYNDVSFYVETGKYTGEIILSAADNSIITTWQFVINVEGSVADDSKLVTEITTGAVDYITHKIAEISGKVDDAANAAAMSKSYAVGGTGTRTGEDTDNSKYYYGKIEDLFKTSGTALRQKGNKKFTDLPSDPNISDTYNIIDDFTTDDRFVDGAGKTYMAGTNVYYTTDHKWDCLSPAEISLYSADDIDIINLFSV